MKPITLPLLAILALLAGCQNDQPHGEFPAGNDAIPPAETRQANRFLAAQSAAGARHDAMMYDHHFNGASLNSLGQQKLTLIAHVGDSGFPVVVYMNMSQDAVTADRKTAVVAFLKDQGLLDSQIDIRPGFNPDATLPAADNMSDLANLNSGASSSSATPAPGYGSSSSSSGPGSSPGSSSGTGH